MKLWKQMAALLAVCLAVVLLPHPASAAGGQVGAFTYELKGNGTAVVTQFDWSKHSGGDIYVPRSFDGYQVTEIGEMAFSAATCGYSEDTAYGRRINTVGQQVAVVLPDTITVIADKAFFCTKITACDIPESVQLIGEGAFAGCTNIRQYSVNSRNRTFAVIDGVLFNKAKKELIAFPPAYPASSEYTIPTGIKSIGNYAFFGCAYSSQNGAKIHFADTVTAIGNYAFYGAKLALKKSTPSLTRIGDYAFAYCDLSTYRGVEMMHPKTIGAYSFQQCEIESDAFVSLDQTESIGEGAFADLDFGAKFKDASKAFYTSIADSQITTVPARAFEHFMFSLTAEFTLPETVTTIGENAFAKTTWLNAVIPASVKTIEKGAFSQANEISIFFAESSNLSVIEDQAFLNTVFRDNTITLPGSVEQLGYQCFYFSELKSTQHLGMVTIPENVTSIGDQVVNRSHVVLQVTAGSYADIWASENGYPMQVDDTSWLLD